MSPLPPLHWRQCPALGLAVCFAVGIGLAADTTGPEAFGAWAAGAAAALAAAGVASRGVAGRLVTLAPLRQTLAAGAAVVALGGAAFCADQQRSARDVGRLAEAPAAGAEPVVLVGRVVDFPVDAGAGTRFTFEAWRLEAPWTHAVEGRLQVTLAARGAAEGAMFASVAPGDVLRLTGTLRPLPFRRNPADFDYGAYLRRRGVRALLRVQAPEEVAVIGAARSPLGVAAVRLHAHARRQVERHVPAPAARAVLRALLLGDRSALDETTRGRFVRTGLMHLLAVSGLHVLLVGMLFYELLRPLLVRLRLTWWGVELSRAAATLVLLVVYLLVTGASASVARAVVMAALFMGATLVQRSSPPMNALGVAACGLLAWRPAFLFDAGFQLSFAAVAAIVLLNPVLAGMVPARWRGGEGARLRRAVGVSVGTSLSATLGTMPLLLAHFGQTSFAGLLLNLAAVPLTGAALSAGLLTLLFGGWLDKAAASFGAAADLLVRVLLRVAAQGDALLGWAVVAYPLRDPWLLVAAAAALGGLALWPRPRLRWRLALVACFCAGASLWTGVFRGAHAPALEVIFFDVGQGDAALFTTPSGRRLLMDAGVRDERSDSGTRVLLPHLGSFGIDHLDAVVVSHPHSDHLGGLPALLRGVSVGHVYVNGQSYPSDLFAETTHLLDSLAVPTTAVRAGDVIALDPAVRIQVLSPAGPVLSQEEANDASVVLRVVYGTTRFLLLGDAERKAESTLVARFGRVLASDVVKVGHHGSRTSSTPALVGRTMAPGTRAVVSVGAVNRYGLPDEDALARWTAAGARLHLTSHAGALWLRSDGRSVAEVAW